MSIYWDLLGPAKAAVEAIAGFSGIPIAFCKKPQWIQLQHSTIQVLVCTPADLTEMLPDDADSESFEQGAQLIFSVYVGIIHDERYDEATLRWRLDRREDVRKALWNLQVMGDLAFDVTYDPSGAGAQRCGAPNVDESWQRFDYKVSTTRTDQRGG